MTRRQAILAVLALPLADVRVIHGQSGRLTIPLDQWHTLALTYRGQAIELSTAEVFAALKEDR